MKRFVQFLKPVKVLPTVNNGNPTSRRKMDTLFKTWLEESDTPRKQKRQCVLNSWLKTK